MKAEGIFGHHNHEGAPSVDGNPIAPITSGLGSTNIYEELGVTPLVNINGTLTVIGGSIIPVEAMELYRQGNAHCCQSSMTWKWLQVNGWRSYAIGPMAIPVW